MDLASYESIPMWYEFIPSLYGHDGGHLLIAEIAITKLNSLQHLEGSKKNFSTDSWHITVEECKFLQLGSSSLDKFEILFVYCNS